MQYEFICSSCEKSFETNLLMVNREQPLSEPCPNCKKRKSVTRVINFLPITHDTIHPARRAGSGWNDVLKKISKPCRHYSKIEHY